MAIWTADVCSRAARQLICIVPTGRLRLRHMGKTDPQCGQHSPILLSLGPPHLLSSYWLYGRHHAAVKERESV